MAVSNLRWIVDRAAKAQWYVNDEPCDRPGENLFAMSRLFQLAFDIITHRAREIRIFCIACGVVGVGFAIKALMAGDRWAVFVALLLILLATFAQISMRSLLVAMNGRIARLERVVQGLSRRMDTATSKTSNPPNEEDVEPATTVLDLANVGVGNPNVLAAATLDRSRFPRLVETMDRSTQSHGAEKSTNSIGPAQQPVAATSADESVSILNLMRQWKLAQRAGDLSTCRQVFSAFIEVADDVRITPLRRELSLLSDRVERELRTKFSDCMGRRDFPGMLDVGEQIIALLPDRSVADDYRKIEPHIVRRVAEQDGERARLGS